MIRRLGLALVCAVTVGFLSGPLVALLLRVPLADLARRLADPIVVNALRLSLISTVVSLLLMMAFGTPLAYALARRRFPGKWLVEGLVELPIILPPAVAGVALLFTFGRRGLLGPALAAVGVDIAFSFAAVVLAQTFVAAPFYIKAARISFADVPEELLQAAATEGAGDGQVFRHILAPLALPGLLGGAVLGWARALGEFGATILFAGNFPGRTQTMPLAIYLALETDLDTTLVLAAILVSTSFVFLLAFKLLTGRTVDAGMA
ncbi:MAG TPA: ABC transporter permease [Chloroflexia bacterium]|nr:ABC transporter permease [Chloroflexia bacterium]